MAVKKMDHKNIGKMLRFHRKQAGLSQEELATLAGIGKTSIFDIEQGKLTIRFSTLLTLLNALNIQISFDSKIMGHFNENG